MSEIGGSSVDVILAAHSVHWFDYEDTIVEFNRIAREKSKIFVIHNFNMSDDSLSAATAELVTKYRIALEAQGQDHENTQNYFENGTVRHDQFDFETVRSFDTYIGSLLSASFTPNKEDSICPNMESDAREIFSKFSDQDELLTRTRTSITYGDLRRV